MKFAVDSSWTPVSGISTTSRNVEILQIYRILTEDLRLILHGESLRQVYNCAICRRFAVG